MLEKFQKKNDCLIGVLNENYINNNDVHKKSQGSII